MKLQKKKYVAAEYKFCLNEHKKYLAAWGLDKRAQTWETLCAARVKFAEKSGYGPSADETVWIFKGFS